MFVTSDVAIAAGGRIEGAYAERAGTPVKALARIRKRSMLDRAIDAALDVAPTGRVAVVGGTGVRAICLARGVRWIEEAPTGAENVRRALTAWPGRPITFLTSDMPYVTGAALRAFLERVPVDAVAMPIAAYEAFLGRFPESPPFGVTLAGERIVNGGVLYVAADATLPVAKLAGTFFNARKSPLRMAAAVGPLTFARLLLRRLSVSGLECRGSEILQRPVLAVRNCSPELAYDADGLAEYEYACRVE